MCMRRTILFGLFSLCALLGMAQTAELMRIYTDKDTYLAGEELWVKVTVEDEAYPGNAVSQVAYVEICDSAQVRAQGKVALNQGKGWACIQLPPTMHSGVYQLTAYTRYMRNLNPESFPRKYLAVLNTLGSSTEDNLIANDSTVFPKAVSDASESHLMKTDKKVYGLREKVALTWSAHLAEAKDLTLSVVRKDCEVKLPQPKVASPVPAGGERWIAECEGHIVTGRVEGNALPEQLLTQLSCVGKEMKVFEGKKKEADSYRFYTYGVNGQQDIVLSALDNVGRAYRMEVETPFAELLPRQLPDLYCRFDESAMISRSVALQLTQAMPKAVLPKALESVIYGQLPSKTYNLDEYVRFNTVKECIVEFVLGAAMEKQGDKTVIKMLQEDSKAYNMFPVLVLIDGVAFYNHAEVLAYNGHNVQYIHQYRGNYALGETLYGGILSLITHRGTMQDMRINKDMQMLAYEFPQDRPAFELPDYGKAEVKASRRPDFRHTLYWNPSVEGKTEASFYTSDLEGTYVATLQGVDAEGKKIEIEWEFVVEL